MDDVKPSPGLLPVQFRAGSLSVLFFLAAATSFLTGQVLFVDGGITAAQ